jgi:hypothetical protein
MGPNDEYESSRDAWQEGYESDGNDTLPGGGTYDGGGGGKDYDDSDWNDF